MSDTPIDDIRRSLKELREELRAMGPAFPEVQRELDFSQIVWDCIPLMLVDLDGMRILRATPAAHEMFGYELWDLIGTNVNDLIPHQFRAKHDEHVAAYKSDPHDRQMGHQAGIQLAGLKKNGLVIELEIGLYASRSTKNQVFLTIQKTGDSHG
jgi:PAS domain S-box-containing protein